MFKKQLPQNLVEKGRIFKYEILSEFFLKNVTLSVLELEKESKIAEHKHETDYEWYIDLFHKKVYFCDIGNSHSLENLTGKTLWIFSIKVKK